MDGVTRPQMLLNRRRCT